MTAVSYRLATGEDLGFVIATWIESFRTAHAAGPVPMDMYVDVYRVAIGRLLERPATDVVVAASELDGKEDPLGFLCAERNPRGPLVHYLYVRQSQRRQGIARSLFREADIDPRRPFVYTYRTALGARLARDKCFTAKHDPLCARFPSAYAEDR